MRAPRSRPARSGAPRSRERERWTNLALGALVIAAVTTGLAANTQGTAAGYWVVLAHGVAGVSLVLLSRVKTRIAARSLGRPRRRRGWQLSLVLAVLVVVTLVSGFASAAGFTGRLVALTVMQIHIGAAVGALALAAVHYRQRPVSAKPGGGRRRGSQEPSDAASPASSAQPGSMPRVSTTQVEGGGRRDLLRTGVLAAAASVGLLGWERMLDVTGAAGGARRWTGSHERGSGDPDALPVTQWLDDPVLRLDPTTWTVTVDGRAWTVDELRAMPQDEVTTILDCTSLWWSRQTWSGVRLDRLIARGADGRGGSVADAAQIIPAEETRSIWVRSATGYGLRLPVRDLDRVWLALDHGGRPLTAGHGAPARLVCPGRRGFWWVKWVATIDTSDVPWWVQPPFPLT